MKKFEAFGENHVIIKFDYIHYTLYITDCTIEEALIVRIVVYAKHVIVINMHGNLIITGITLNMQI